MNNEKRLRLEKSAQKNMNKKAYSKAIKEYLSLLKYFPEETSYIKLIAQCYQNNLEKENAIKYYTILTDLYREKSLYKQAIAIYKMMVSLDDSTKIYDNLASSYSAINMNNDAAVVYRKPLEKAMLEKNYKKAIEISDKILSYNKNDTIAIINIAEAKFAVGNQEEAVLFFKKAASLYKIQGNFNMYIKILGRINHLTNESDAEILNELATLYISQKLYGPELLEILLKSYRIAKSDNNIDSLIQTTKLLVTFFKETNQRKQMLSIRYELAKIYEDIGDLDKALESYSKILEIAPSSLEVKKKAELISEKIKLSKSKKLTIENESIIETPTTDYKREKVKIKNSMTEVDTYVKFGLYDKAISVVEKLNQRYPKSSLVLKKLKDIYIESSDMQNAKKTLLKMFKLVENTNQEEAINILKEILEISPNDKSIKELLEKFNSNNNELDEIERITDENSLIDPEDIMEIQESDNEEDKIIGEINYHIKNGKYDTAESLLKPLLKKEPNNRTYLELKKKIEQNNPKTNLDNMLGMFKEGIDLNNQNRDDQTRYDLAIAYKEMGLLDTAIDEFKSLLKSSRNKADLLSMIGLCYVEQGNYDIAIKYFKKALELSTSLHEKVSMYYELANIYELKGNLEYSLNIFLKLVKKDKNYRDITRRIENLKKKLSTPIAREISYL